MVGAKEKELVVFNGYSASIWRDENIRDEWQSLHSNVNVLMSLNLVLKND